MDEAIEILKREDPEIDAYFRLSRMVKQQNIEGIETFHQNHPNLVKASKLSKFGRVLEPLFYAAVHGYPESLKKLIQLGYDPDIIDREEDDLEPMTALEHLSITEIAGKYHFKTPKPNLECVKILMKYSTKVPDYWERYFDLVEKLIHNEYFLNTSRILNERPNKKNHAYTIKELRDLCTEKRLDFKGNKADLVQRLREYAETEEPKRRKEIIESVRNLEEMQNVIVVDKLS